MNFTPLARSLSLPRRWRSMIGGLAAAAALTAGGCGCVAAAPGAAVTAGSSADALKRFPVVGPVRFQNDFGAPRGGGSRRHQGVDIMADRGQRVLAVEAGTITSQKYSSSCGYSLGLSGDDGNYYLYCHLDGYTSGIAKGDRVWAGKQVGTVGSTGNAAYAYPHLHLQMHPNGARGAAANPYYQLREAEGRAGVLTSPPKGWR